MDRQKRIITSITVALLGMAALVQANATQAAIIDYTIAPPATGTISYAGGNTALVGTNISINSLLGTSASGIPANADTLFNCSGCQLNFTTGNYFAGQTNNQTGTTEWMFNGGGNISLTGAVTDSGNNIVVANSTLFSGTFTGAATVQFSAGMLTFSVAQGAFTGQNDTSLLSLFGLAAGLPMSGGMNISFMPVGTPAVNAGFTSSSLYSGNVINDVVPLPAAAWLFISGLFGLGVLRRKSAV